MTNSDHIELRVAQIISTERRKEILNAILAQNGLFTVAGIYDYLQSKNVKIKLTAVLNVVKSLHYAGFLSEETERKEVRKEGRPKNLYRVVAEVAGRKVQEGI